MKIFLQGQLAIAANLNTITKEIPQGTTLAQLIQEIATTLPAEAQNLLLTEQGTPRTSLFAALDTQHQRDLNIPIPPETKELTLMPPMAGG